MSLFSCSGCFEIIPATKPRIQCQNCVSTELCAACYVLLRFANPPYIIAGYHIVTHQTLLFRTSGYSAPPPHIPLQQTYAPVQPAPAQYAVQNPVHQSPLPPAQQTFQPTPPAPYMNNAASSTNASPVASVSPQPKPAPPQVSHTPAATGPGQWSSPAPAEMPAEAVARPIQTPSVHRTLSVASTNQSTLSNANGIPQTPPSAQPPPASNTPQAPSTSSMIWQSFFDLNSQPTSTFIELINSIFTYLDPHRTETLSPEVYSSFLDAQGYEVQFNVCKISKKISNTDTRREEIQDSGVWTGCLYHSRLRVEASLRQLLNRLRCCTAP